MHDTRTPVVAGIIIIVLNIAIGIALLDRLGYLALALALSASTTVEAIILAGVLRNRLGGVTPRTRDWLVRVVAATAVTALVAAALAGPLSEATTPGNGPRLQQLAVFVFALAVVAAVYLGCAWMLRLPELFESLAHLAGRLERLRRLPASARR